MPTSTSLPDSVDRAVSSCLAAADRLLPGAVTNLAVTGSTALGAYRDGASDIDLVAVLDDEWQGRRELIPGFGFCTCPRGHGSSVAWSAD